MWRIALILLAGERLYASPACSECHSDISERQIVSRHAQALRPYAGSRMSAMLERAPVYGGDRVYRYGSRGVSTGGVEAPLDWAFGAGSYGFTAVGKLEGRFFEHRVSWFVNTGKPGVTPGQAAHGELGVFKTPAEAFACFNCHATGLARLASGAPAVDTMTPGLQCERCHGPGTAHAEAAHQGRSEEEIRKAIVVKTSLESCGECHRTKGDWRSVETVRFQPVGLMASRCFRGNGKLLCTTCHDPHTDAVRNDAAYYAAKCGACHASGCLTKTAEANCVACHMRKVELGAGLVFTDHRIH